MQRTFGDHARISRATVRGAMADREAASHVVQLRRFVENETATQRANEIRMLDEALDGGHDLDDRTLEAFEEWRTWLRGSPRRYLSEKSRSWLTDVAKRLGVSTTGPAKTAAEIPRGREVVLNLGPLPTKPPTRRPAPEDT